jgi:hypothetical protein
VGAQPQERDVRAEVNWAKNGAALLVLVVAFTAQAKANVAVLLEEPYSYDGALAGTGHTAVYLTGVCAETPVKLRLCNAGERGVVISRYHRIAGYDWIAIPLIPYLYAVETPDQVPLFADPKLEAFLRDQYRRAYLEDLAPDGPNGETPRGDWYELVGSSYDRTNYAFEIETTSEQDRAVIEWMNSRPNRANYDFISSNCADFVREVLNFYYPKSESRGNIADLFVTTPKHAAKSLVRYSGRHRDLGFTHFVIPQVPGSVRRSRPVHGVLESVARGKKYMLALALFHPFIAGGVASAYVVGDRFNPAGSAEVFSLGGQLEPAPSRAEKRAYLRKLHSLAPDGERCGESDGEVAWKQFLQKAAPELDAEGQAGLESPSGDVPIRLGVTRTGLEADSASLDFQESLMVARIKQALRRSRAPRVSSRELRADWELLEKIDVARRARIADDSGEPTGTVSQSKDRTFD